MSNGVSLVEEARFWEFCAKHNTFIGHNPDGKGKELKFARYNDESTIKQQTELGDIRLELRDTPTGVFTTADSGRQLDAMSRTVRVVAKVAVNDFDDKLAKQDTCKKALLEIIRYIEQQQEAGNTCNTILHLFDIKQVPYDIIESAAADGSFTGVQMRVKFNEKISNATVAYPAFV